jgi:hypothetical protein
MEFTADDRAVLSNLTDEIKALREPLNYVSSSFSQERADAFITAINKLSTAIDKLSGHVMNLDPER